MIRTETFKKKGEVRVTFALPQDDPRLPASVVGDFNGWDPHAHPLRKRANRTWSVAVTLPIGSRHEFRYLGAAGKWFDESPDGSLVTRQPGRPNCVLRV
jgi:1,4-alpha-glucan branching enzyme